MDNVINFAAWKNAKRVDAVKAEVSAAAAERIVDKKVAVAGDLVEQLGLDIPAAAFVANAIVEKAEELKAAKHRPQPAYCDPGNEVRGAKYEASRNLDIVEIAKRMRADIKALKLPVGYKASVRARRFSGGQAIDIVMAVPESFVFWSDKCAAWVKQFGRDALHRFPGARDKQHSPEYLDLSAKLDAIHGAYNRDNSDSMSDYFDVRYYGGARIEGAWAALEREAAAAEPCWHESSYP